MVKVPAGRYAEPGVVLVVKVAWPPLVIAVPSGVVVPLRLKVTVSPSGTGPPPEGVDMVAVNVTACPIVDGEPDVATAVVVGYFFTASPKEMEVLPVKLLSPGYLAVRVRVPAVVNVSMQEPEGALAVQLWPVLALTVTTPEGIKLTPACGDTVKLTVTAWPTKAGLGTTEVMAVEVLAFVAVPLS